jgi:uncharacterized repeat protein (TIGR01451 family)
MGARLTRRLRLGVAVACVATVTLTLAGAAFTAITPTGTATNLSGAIAVDGSVVTGASFTAIPPEGTPNAVADSATSLGGFPTNGSTYAIMTSGDPLLADDANSAGNSGADLNGPNVRGNTDFDVTVLKIDLNVPSGRNCLTFDFRFLSDEFPEFVGSNFNDAFIAELDTSTWTTSGSDITAPNNFAFDPDDNVISINAAGAASMSAGEATGTTYDGATPLLSASTPITSGAHSLYLSIFDQGDQIYDSAAFVDRLVLGTTAPGGCVAGATVLTTTKTADSPTTVAGGTNGYTITISNPSASAVSLASIFDVLPAGFSYVPGSTTGVTTSNPTIASQTLTWTGPFNVPAGGNVTLSFDVTVSSTPGQYFNDAGGTVAEGSVEPTGPTAPITVTEEAPDSADLSITKSDSPDPVVVGNNLTYTIMVTNAGPDTASSVTVSDTLPAGVTFVSAGAGCTHAAGTVTCTLGDIASGGSETRTIVVTPGSTGTISNTATVSSTTADPNTANNSDTETTTVEEEEPPPTGFSCGEVRGDGRIHTNPDFRYVLYNLKRLANQTAPSGEISFTDLKNKQDKKKFVSTSITTFQIVGSTAVIEGAGLYNGSTPVTYRMVVTDGSPDTFSIVLSNGYSASGNVTNGRGINIKPCDPS